METAGLQELAQDLRQSLWLCFIYLLMEDSGDSPLGSLLIWCHCLLSLPNILLLPLQQLPLAMSPWLTLFPQEAKYYGSNYCNLSSTVPLSLCAMPPSSNLIIQDVTCYQSCHLQEKRQLRPPVSECVKQVKNKSWFLHSWNNRTFTDEKQQQETSDSITVPMLISKAEGSFSSLVFHDNHVSPCILFYFEVPLPFLPLTLLPPYFSILADMWNFCSHKPEVDAKIIY